MRSSELFRLLPLFFFLCNLTACNDVDVMRVSSVQETIMKGDASTLQINMTRSNWRIASITDLDGYSPIGDTTQLEGLGTICCGWVTIHRNNENALTIETKDNFEGCERGFIIHLQMKAGLYKEQIVVLQKPCENFYQIEDIEYSVEETDGVEEAETQIFKNNYKDESIGGETRKWNYKPFLNVSTEYKFLFDDQSGEVFSWVNPKKCNMLLPDRIENGKVIMGEHELPFCTFGQYYKDDELRHKIFEVDFESQLWNIYSGIIYCKRLQVTFTVTLSRPGSDTKKVFKGKFIQKYPYGCSPVQHEVNESLDNTNVTK